MTMYQDIYQDLPGRVHRVWQRTNTSSNSDCTEDLSVTAMLMAAATGFAMPWESLKNVGSGNRNDWNNHPSFANGDQVHYQSILKKCDKFLSQKISDTNSLKSISFLHCSEQSDISGAIEFENGEKKTGDQKAHRAMCCSRSQKCTRSQQHRGIWNEPRSDRKTRFLF